MKTNFLCLLILLTIPYNIALAMNECKQEDGQFTQTLGILTIGDDWNSKHRNMRFKLLTYKALAHTRKEQNNELKAIIEKLDTINKQLTQQEDFGH